MARIIIADGHSLYRRGLRRVLESAIDRVDVVEIDLFDALLHVLEQPEPIDLALIDLSLTGIGEISVVRDLRRSFMSTRFIIISADGSLNVVLEALAAGLHGFISKTQTDDEIVAAVSDVLSGRIYVPPTIVRSANDPATVPPGHSVGRIARRPDPLSLTPRQREVLTLIADGFSNKEIARKLAIAEPTTKIHVAALMRALGVRNRTEAAMLAISWLAWPAGQVPRNGHPPVLGDGSTKPT